MEEDKLEWSEYFKQLATLTAAKSKDRSTQVGAVVVGGDNAIRSTGFNGFPRCINDDIDSRHERPAKYSWTEHAERNAIYNAARMGVSTDKCILYVTHEPCMECSRAIVQSGILKVIINKDNTMSSNKKMYDPLGIGPEMLKEAGIVVSYE